MTQDTLCEGQPFGLSDGECKDQIVHFRVLKVDGSYEHKSTYIANLDVPALARVKHKHYMSNQHLLHGVHREKEAYIVVTNAVIMCDASGTLEEFFSCSTCGNCSYRLPKELDKEKSVFSRFFTASGVFMFSDAVFEPSSAPLSPSDAANASADSICGFAAACSHVTDLVYHLHARRKLRCAVDVPSGALLRAFPLWREHLRDRTKDASDNPYLRVANLLPKQLSVTNTDLMFASPNANEWTGGQLWGIVSAKALSDYTFSDKELKDIDLSETKLWCRTCGKANGLCSHAAYAKRAFAQYREEKPRAAKKSAAQRTAQVRHSHVQLPSC
jgi:hypothetical protein